MHSCEHDFWDHSCLLNFTCLETKSIFHIWGSSIYVLNIKVCSIWGSYNSLILQLVQVTLWYILLCSWSHDCILVSTFSLQGRLKLHTPFRHEPKKNCPIGFGPMKRVQTSWNSGTPRVHKQGMSWWAPDTLRIGVVVWCALSCSILYAATPQCAQEIPC